VNDPTACRRASAGKVWIELAGHFVRHRDVEPVKRDRYCAIEANEVDQLGRALLTEQPDSLPVRQFRKQAAGDQRGGNVVSNRFLAGEVARALAGRNGRDLLVRQSAASATSTWA
jgi:hypothetical protein